jgi:quercetin dioxygenase-like cupin family protein
VKDTIKDSLIMVALNIKVRKLSEEPGINETQDGYKNVNTVWAVLKRTDISAFSSRIFRIEQGGHTSTHKHTREHVAIVISGNCSVASSDEEKIVSQGSIITVPQQLPHKHIYRSCRKNTRLNRWWGIYEGNWCKSAHGKDRFQRGLISVRYDSLLYP